MKESLKIFLKSFVKSPHEELFDTKEEAINFYTKKENYRALPMNGDIGENLMTKYTGRGLLILDDIISTLFLVIREKFKDKLNRELNIVLDSSENG